MQKHKIYLAGPIQDCEDLGVGWREEVLQKYGDLADFALPSNFVIENGKIVNLERDIPMRKTVKELGFDAFVDPGFSKVLHEIKVHDLALLDTCEAMLVRYGPETSGGTMGELTHGWHGGKYIIIWVDGVPIEDINWWALSCANDVIFSLDALPSTLQLVKPGRDSLHDSLEPMISMHNGIATASGFHSIHVDDPEEIWKDGGIIPRWMALLHSEVTEAFEAHRNDDKENFVEELADIFIRLCDDIGSLDMAKEFVEALDDKMEKNRKRPRMHGKRY